RRLRGGREDRLRQLRRLRQPGRQRVPADGTGLAVVLPARAREIAADDALDREHLEAPALGRAAVPPQCDEVIRTDVARACEPESRQSGQDTTLVGDLGREDDV